MFSTLSILVLGFVLGMRHATDADHVVAVTTIVSRQPSLSRASMIGALWGLGHTATILLVGGAIVVFRFTIPPRMGLAMEFVVALMLILLGALNLSGRTHRALHSAMRPLLVGFVHGLAGSAFVAMLVLTAIPKPVWGMAYLLVFGVGTIGGMMLVTLAIATPSALTARRFGNVQRYLRVASGVASIAFGLFLAHQVGVRDGLFSANPIWTPR
jgi:high-affinity nickel-transport protein